PPAAVPGRARSIGRAHATAARPTRVVRNPYRPTPRFGVWSGHEEPRTVLLDGAGPRSARGALDPADRARAALRKPALRGGPARDPAHLAHDALRALPRASRRGRGRAGRRPRRARVPVDAGG